MPASMQWAARPLEDVYNEPERTDYRHKASTEDAMNLPYPTTHKRIKGTVAFAFLLLAALVPLANYWSSARADTLFPQTGYNIWGPFEEYWNANGGMEQFGLPRTSVYPAGPDYDAQWFERALFTYNPSNPEPYKVELGLLGNLITEDRRTEPPFLPAKQAIDGEYFDATQHNLSGKFLKYWQDTGGLAIYGYPISEAFIEQSKSDGKTYLVQYFERNRLELHPEAAGTKWEVELGLLGSELLDAQGGPQAIAKLGSGKFYPHPEAGIHVPPGGIVDSPNAGTPGPVDKSIPPAPALPSTTRKVLFETEFSSPDLSAWLPESAYNPPDATPASWQVEGGLLHQSGVAGEDEDASLDALLVTKDKSASDIVLDSLVFPGGGESLGLVLRWSPDGYYLARLYANAPNDQPKAQIVRVTLLSQTVLAESKDWPGYTARQWLHASLSAQGSHLWLEVNGEKIAEANDSELAEGSFGFYAYADGTAYFDNVRATLP